MLSSDDLAADKEFIKALRFDPTKLLVSLYDHSKARDYLIFTIVHSNAKRSGFAKGMLVSEFKNAL